MLKKDSWSQHPKSMAVLATLLLMIVMGTITAIGIWGLMLIIDKLG